MSGRRGFEPSDEQRRAVKTMTAHGIPLEQIARVVTHPRSGRPISRTSLSRYFAREIATGATEANLKVAQSLYRQAVEGHVAAAIFWCKTRMGWRETSRREGEADAAPAVVESRIDLTGDDAPR